MKFRINYTLLSVFAAGLLALSGDITLTWTSPIYPQLYSNDTSINPLGKPITAEEDSWIGSLLNIGAIIGPLPFSFISEKFGRRIALLTLAFPQIIGFLTFAFAKNVYLFYFARFLGGLGIGGTYTILPMYIAELSEDSTRGMYSVSLILFWSFGNLVPYVIGPFLSVMVFNLIITIFPVAFLVAFLFVGVETPYYWLKINRPDKAEECLMELRSLNKKNVEDELKHIQENMKREEGGHFTDIIKDPGLRKALIISLILIAFQQFSGFSGITFYLEPIFNAAGTEMDSDVSSLIVGFAIFFSSFIVQFLVDRFGRRTLIIGSCIGMVLSLSMMGAFFYLLESTNVDPDPIFWLPLFSLVFYLFSYAAGLSIIPWTISSELFPTNVKQISASAVSSVCWLSSFIVTILFNTMDDKLGTAGTFWLYAGCCLAALIFSIFFVQETKDKSFREIQDMLRS